MLKLLKPSKAGGKTGVTQRGLALMFGLSWRLGDGDVMDTRRQQGTGTCNQATDGETSQLGFWRHVIG